MNYISSYIVSTVNLSKIYGLFDPNHNSAYQLATEMTSSPVEDSCVELNKGSTGIFIAWKD